MSERSLSPETFSADYVGEPGRRTFYLQALTEGLPESFLIEKQQVQLLAERLRDVLLMIDADDTVKSTMAARDPALALQEPIEPTWRVGSMGLAYEEDQDRVILLLEEASEQDPDSESDSDTLRISLRRDQSRAFVLHAFAVVEEGRPLCQFCGLPMDPAGHRCPASNGHHPQT